MPFQIVGSDGAQLGEDDSQALVILSGVERGSLDPVVGASLLPGLRLSPPVQNRVMSSSVLNAATRAMGSRGPMGALGAGIAASIQQMGPHVASAQPGPLREVVQGINSTGTVAAGASQTILVTASMIFRPSRLMIGPTFASLFVIEDIRVAADSLFLSSGAVPGEVFLPGAVGASSLKRRTAQPGTPISIIVTNIDGLAHSFRSALFGDASDVSSC